MSKFLCRVLINSRHYGDTINLLEVDSREGADTWNTSMKWININEKFLELNINVFGSTIFSVDINSKYWV